ncbi:MAG: amidohydrolase [Solirubrobacterales bacterium]|nr:amidohydrolase [Solirubrobacterales bacterium]
MPAIDCDVHCAPASFEALFPYLSDYWRQYITEGGVRLGGVAFAYPPLAPTTAVPAAREQAAREQAAPPTPESYDQLKESVLDRADPRAVVLNCLTGFETHRNAYYSAAVASAVNDWLREEFLARDDRLRASLVVSTISTEDAVAEIERVGGEPGFVQVLLPVRSDVPWGNKRNHPIFAAACAHSLHVGLHAWGRAGRAPTPSGFTSTYLEDYLGNQPIAQAQVLSFVSEGVFDRFPDLKVLLMECGFAWLPPLLWRFDKDWRGVWREVPWVKGLPSEYVAEHFRFTTAPAHLPRDRAAIGQLLEMLDAGGLLAYASDYPHNHGDGLTVLLDQLDEDARAAVMGGNAAALYGLP